MYVRVPYIPYGDVVLMYNESKMIKTCNMSIPFLDYVTFLDNLKIDCKLFAPVNEEGVTKQIGQVRPGCLGGNDLINGYVDMVYYECKVVKVVMINEGCYCYGCKLIHNDIYQCMCCERSIGKINQMVYLNECVMQNDYITISNTFLPEEECKFYSFDDVSTHKCFYVIRPVSVRDGSCYTIIHSF